MLSMAEMLFFKKFYKMGECCMKPNTRERVDKAEGDLYTEQWEVRARKHPNYDAACFHAQQRAEKYLEARLSWRHNRQGNGA